MKFLEKDLEEIIFNSCKSKLWNKGLLLPERIKRQVRIGNYGIADLIGFEKEYIGIRGVWTECPSVTVYELKQQSVSISAFLQAVRYAKGVKHYLQKRNPLMYKNLKINIVIIGDKIDINSDLVYLTDMISGDLFSVTFYTYSYDVDGILFYKHKGYQLSEPNF